LGIKKVYLQIPLFKVRVGSSPIWTLTNVGIKFHVTEKILFPKTLIGVVFYIGFNFLPYGNDRVMIEFVFEHNLINQ